MDKRNVIAAYRRGHLSVRECAQILGLEQVELLPYMQEWRNSLAKAGKRRSVRL